MKENFTVSYNKPNKKTANHKRRNICNLFKNVFYRVHFFPLAQM